ncbi:MAG: hypothetical protein ACKVUT_13620 [Gaiella sp.]
MTNNDLTRLLRDANPVPDDAPIDPIVLARVEARVKKELRTMETRPTRSTIVRLAVATSLVLLAVALGLTRFTGGDGGEAAGGGVALGGGDAISSCIVFSVHELARAPIAFDGTVERIDGENIDLRVERWYRGGEGDRIRVFAPELANAEALVGAVGFEVGKRYLVSATEFEGKVIPNVCGFSVTYDEGMAETFAEAFGS